MPAYVIFQENIFDQDGFEHYKTLSPASIEKFKGRFIVRGGPITVLEGAFAYERVVVIEFPTADAARDWHASTEYEEAKNLRLQISEGQCVVVEGV